MVLRTPARTNGEKGSITHMISDGMSPRRNDEQLADEHDNHVDRPAEELLREIHEDEARIEGDIDRLKQDEWRLEKDEGSLEHLVKCCGRRDCECKDARHDVTVKVNTRDVVMPTHHATGLQVKEVAIGRGIAIQLDFVLEVKRTGKWDVVADDECLCLHECEEFSAVAPDDNS